jgi:hypothetical protein
MADTILDLIDGEDIVKQEKIFSTAMTEIEELFPDFFKNQSDPYELFDHNKLHNYISFGSEGTRFLPDNKRVKQINLSIKQELPEEIKKSYLELVDKKLKEFNLTK